MDAMQVIRTGERLSVEPIKRPKPVAGPGEVLIQVVAAGITPTELGWYPTTHQKDGSARAGAIPGHEFAGIVASVGEGVEAFTGGQAVYGMNDWFQEGASAEYCLASPASITPRPATLTSDEAATVPIAALTAWQGLVSRAAIQPGERVLVQGGAGSVGSFAVQLAALLGARVIATAGADAFPFVKELGAAEVLDYRQQAVAEHLEPVDVIFDTVGGDTLARSWTLLKPGGRMVTIAADVEGSTDARTKEAFFIVQPDADQLKQITGLLDAGKLRTGVKAVVPFREAPQAYANVFKLQRTFGKMVLAIRPPEGQ